MSVIVQISDPHFGTEQAPVVEALVHLIHRQSPDLLVLSGDITQRARRAQFAAARAFVDRLDIAATLVIPGNHDIPLYNLAGRLLAPYSRHCHAFGADLEPQFESDQLLVITVNTTRWYRHTDGEVSAAQIERVAQRLVQASARQLRVVVTHQPIAVARPQDEIDLLHNADAAIQHWAMAGADLVLGGHIHLPFAVPLHQRIPSLPRPLWAIQAGTAVSSRVRHDAGNSINLIRYADGQTHHRQAVLEQWDYQPAQQAFECVKVTPLECGALNDAT
jgi:3',5'-cyclic AMP phosphodiesterase CpdA